MVQGIYDTLKECACISKSAGGIGLSIHNIRSVGSYIRGTNGNSNGIVPMIRVFNDTARCDTALAAGPEVGLPQGCCCAQLVFAGLLAAPAGHWHVQSCRGCERQGMHCRQLCFSLLPSSCQSKM